ncbi:MAG: hypothetical protein ABL868_11250 [Sulfuriferula sp.]
MQDLTPSFFASFFVTPSFFAPDELRYGAEIKAEIKQSRERWDEAINFQEREVFEAFLNLPAPQRKIVREVILAFAKAQSV